MPAPKKLILNKLQLRNGGKKAVVSATVDGVPVEGELDRPDGSDGGKWDKIMGAGKFLYRVDGDGTPRGTAKTFDWSDVPASVQNAIQQTMAQAQPKAKR